MTTSGSGVLVVLPLKCDGVSDTLAGIDLRGACVSFLMAVEVFLGLPRFGAILSGELSQSDAFLLGWARTGLVLATFFWAVAFLAGCCGGAVGVSLDAARPEERRFP